METETDFIPHMDDVTYEDHLMENLDWSLAMLFCDTERDVIGPLFNGEEENILTAIFETQPNDEIVPNTQIDTEHSNQASDTEMCSIS